MYYPTLEEARQIAGTGDFRSIPITREILSDFTTPIQAMRILRTESSHCFLQIGRASCRERVSSPV